VGSVKGLSNRLHTLAPVNKKRIYYILGLPVFGKVNEENKD
jgi:hypothetical protein